MVASIIADEEAASIRRLRLASFVETYTLLLLTFVAVPLKYAFGHPGATRLMGPVHGAAFVAYVWCTIAAVSGGGWSRGELGRLILGALIPFGGFANAGLLLSKEKAATAQNGRP